MKLAFPVEDDNGLDSIVYGHFGSAPAFVIVDDKTFDFSEIKNTDQHHSHGMCNPLKALGNQIVDAVVVGGIGMGALVRLNSVGIKVFRGTAGSTVKEHLELYKKGVLLEFLPTDTCAGHGSGSTCSHI